ncbi:TRAP transporter small permease [Elioraea sp.]|uniref:TRAP transporter small permease n=1 Tax=Elioraea sp. TaxID=2185103 RepID=UPI003F70FA7E
MRPILRAAERTVETIGLVCFAAMLLATAAQVLFRYVLEWPVLWTEEAARVLFLLAMMCGFVIAQRRGEHIVVDFLRARLSPRPAAALGALFDLVVLAFLLLLLRGAVRMVELTWGSAFITIPWFTSAHLHLAQIACLVALALLVAGSLIQHCAALARPEPTR